MKFLSEICWDTSILLVSKLYMFQSHSYTWETRAYLAAQVVWLVQAAESKGQQNEYIK